jgi:hypothetical protein
MERLRVQKDGGERRQFLKDLAPTPGMLSLFQILLEMMHLYMITNLVSVAVF